MKNVELAAAMMIAGQALSTPTYGTKQQPRVQHGAPKKVKAKRKAQKLARRKNR